VDVVELPAAPMDLVAENAGALLDAQTRAVDLTVSGSVLDVLAWTWRAITEPVLRALGHTATPDGPVETWPRLWWCPTGPAAVLPLHAAGEHPRTGAEFVAAGDGGQVNAVAGRVVSSYTPTLGALARARRRPAAARVRQLAVGVPDAPGYEPSASPLPAVVKELNAVAVHLPEPEQATRLSGPAANWSAVRAALAEHSWLHLSCHAVQDQADPSSSAFLLYDRPLTLADLTALQLPDPDLAYLAACHTATGSMELIDESLHLAAGLQLVGYRHVVATLWSIADQAAPILARTFYGELTGGAAAGGPDADRSPFALHHAAARIRQAAPGQPLLWAPYLHLGP
jgi:hypothetical protein